MEFNQLLGFSQLFKYDHILIYNTGNINFYVLCWVHQASEMFMSWKITVSSLTTNCGTNQQQCQIPNFQ